MTQIWILLFTFIISSCSSTIYNLGQHKNQILSPTRTTASVITNTSCLELVRQFRTLNSFSLSGKSLSEISSILKTLQENIIKQDLNRDYLQSSADIFKNIFQAVNENLVEIRSSSDDIVFSLYLDQVEMRIKHLILDAPGGRYPFQPSLDTLGDLKVFYRNIDSTIPSRSISKIGNPFDYERLIGEIEAKGRADTKKILKDPELFYENFSERLRKYGPNTSFPEFEGLLNLAEIKLSSDDFISSAKSSPIIAKIRDNIISEIQQIKMRTMPYSDTITTLEKILALFDIQQRAFSDDINFPSLYHSLRWQYHATIMKGSIPEHVLLPSLSPLGITDLLKVRGQPLGFIGFETSPMYVDGHYQSSLEFWFHDFNHSRRMWQQYEERSKELRQSLDTYRKYSNDFVQDEVLPLVKIKKDDSTELKEIKRLAKVILFEIAHEDALPLDKLMLKESLERSPLGIGRFVFETLDRDVSKVSYSRGYNVSVLAITFRKLEGEFYDMNTMRINGLGNEQVRTRQWVLNAANYLNNNLDLGIDPNTLINNVQDDSGLPVDLRAAVIKSSQENPNIEPLNEVAADEHFKRTGEKPTSIPFYKNE